MEIDAGLASKVNIDSIRVWIRTSLTGPNLVEKSLSKEDNPKIIRGWNKIQLDQPYEIKSEEGIISVIPLNNAIKLKRQPLSKSHKKMLFGYD